MNTMAGRVKIVDARKETAASYLNIVMKLARLLLLLVEKN